MRYLIIPALLALSLISCDEPVTLDLDQTQPKIVIEAQVTNKPGYQGVKVTRSADFYSSGKTPRITDAVVRVEDDLGQVFSFIHNPSGHADSLGIYIPQTPFVGEIGRTYTLSVDVNGEVFTGEDKLLSVIPVDSLQFKINEDEEEDPEVEGRIYEMLMFAREPQDQENFYLFKFYRNDSLTYFNDTDIYFTDDEFLAEKIDGVPSPIYYGKNDIGKIEIFSLTRIGYLYYSDLWTVLNNDGGGMFGPIPSSPRTNLTNGALGFFQVSAINASELTVE
jgi:hypothetical protein